MTTDKDMHSDEEAILAARKKAARRNKMQARADEDEISLNINSMMDMMTIILVFLLKSYGAEPIQVNQNDDLRLPFSTSELAPEDTLVISISKRWVMVEEEQVVPIQEGSIDVSRLQSVDSSIAPELQARVEEILREHEQWAQQLGRTHDRVATIISDEYTPYRVLSQVMMTASAGGVQNFKFAILQRQQGSGVQTEL